MEFLYLFCVLLGQFVVSSANLPFLNPSSYSTLSNVDDSTVGVELPTPTQFGSTSYSTAYISSNGLVSFGVSVTEYNPQPFPYIYPILAPYWDDIHLTSTGVLRYAILTPSSDPSIIDDINCLLSSSQGRRISVDWVLWAYWYNICPYQDSSCSINQPNYFQLAMGVQNNSTYSIFIYECDLIRWTRHNAVVGFSADSEFYTNNSLSGTPNITNIDCYQNTSTGYTNIIYTLNDLSALRLQPSFGTILGGDSITVSGPHNLNKSENIKLSFDNGKAMVNCSYVQNTQTARCVAPFLNKEGKMKVELHYNNTVYNRTTVYHSMPVDSNPKVTIGNTTKRYFTSGDKINISWTPSTFSDEPTSKVDVRLYEVEEKSDGTFTNKEIEILGTGLPNNGQATVTVPTSASGNNNKVSSVNIVIQKNTTDDNDVMRDIKQWTGSLWVSRTSSPFSDFLYQKCLQWEQSEANSPSILPETRPCPPTATQAGTENSGFEPKNFLITIFHPLASQCFRQRVPSSSGAGNQCCYRSDNTLIVGPPSGGSVDKVAPTGTGLEYWRKLKGHFTEDVLPYLYCCKGMQRNCTKYYQKRPSDDGSRFSPPVPACVYGDPHIVTLDLHKYTFNGKGEFTLIEMGNGWLTVQGRMVETPNTNGTDAPGTVFSAVAIKQGNSDTVQFELDEFNDFICLINGERVDFSEFKTEEFNNVTVSFINETNAYTATFSRGSFIKVQVDNGFISVLIVSLPDEFRGLTRGLMGNFNGNTSDDLIPNGGGPALPLNSSLQTIHDNFGLTWIVNNSANSLFSYPCARSWATYYDPSFRPSFTPTFSDPSLEQTANQICGNDQFCKFDIAATGRVEVGEATFTGGQNFEQLVNLSQPIICNPPCVHGACVSTDVCACSEGYSGTKCDTIITTPCSDDPCNGGACQYHAGSYICTCPPLLTGPFCEENYTHPCIDDPCVAGTCVFEHGSTNFSCICPPEITGILCELEIMSSSPMMSPTETACLGTTDKSTGDLPVQLVLPVFIVLLLITMTSVGISIILAACLLKQKQSQGKRSDYPSNLYEITDKHELIERGGSPSDTVQDPKGATNYRFDKY